MTSAAAAVVAAPFSAWPAVVRALPVTLSGVVVKTSVSHVWASFVLVAELATELIWDIALVDISRIVTSASRYIATVCLPCTYVNLSGLAHARACPVGRVLRLEGVSEQVRDEDAAPRTGLPAAVLAVDVIAVCSFAAIGRRAHEETNALVGVLQTASPFLVGVALGWLVGRCWRRPGDMRSWLVVWVCTWTVGMLGRQLTGQGTAPSFMLVAAVVLGVMLGGWRALAGLAIHASRRGGGPS